MENKWLALAGSFIIMNLVTGFLHSMNVLYVELIETFSVTRAEATMVQSSVIAVFGLSGLFTGPLINWLGIRRSGFIGTLMTSLALALAYFVNHIILLTVILAVGTGIGSSTMYIAALALVDAYFDRKSKTMATSFVIFGAGIGGVWLPYPIAYLLDEYGLRGTLLISGGILANCFVVFTAISSSEKQLKPDKQLSVDNDKHIFQEQIIKSRNRDACVSFDVNDSMKDCSKHPDQQKNNTTSVICTLLKNMPFMKIVFGFAFAFTAMIAIIFITMDHVEIIGCQRSEGVMLITVINAIDTVSRLLPFLLKQIPKMSDLALSVVMAFIGGVFAICLPFTTEFSVTAFLFSVIGLCQGCMNSTYLPCITKYTGDDQFSPALGMAMAVSGIGVILVGPMTGLINDIWGSYDVAFFLCGGTMLTSSAILAFVFKNNKSL